MHHIWTTPRPPEVETGDSNLQSEILVIFRLGTVPGWVYVAMTGNKEPHCALPRRRSRGYFCHRVD
jgi:hypothetical protein